MTFFIILSILAATVLISAPIVLSRVFGKNRHLDGKIFWRAGLYLLIIEVFYLAVIGNATSLWPVLWDYSDLVKALFVGASTGLFFELGRFLVLDKIFRQLRSYNEGLLFAMGWSGVETLLIGILLVVSTFGMQFIINTGNISTLLPDATKQELAQVEDLKQQSVELMNGNPLMALSPIIERGSRLAFDLSMTMLILLALVKGENKYVWMAVAIRALVTFTAVLIGSLGALAGDLTYLALALFTLFTVNQVRIMLPKQLR